MRRTQLFSVALCLAFIMAACSVSEKNKYVDSKPITIQGTKFIDGFGRQVMLNGVNLVNKNPKENYIGKEDAETFANFNKWGFNVIRLGIIWDGLEPEPGQYDENYLKKIDQQIQWAEDNGVYVFLDMHQDLFSVKYSDGAPKWATLDEGKPHVQGAVWSDAYLISPAVQTSWDNFWANAPVSTGKGVQDHYAAAWQHVAKRYADNKTVIGFDIMNEPFAGSEAQMFMPYMFGAYAQLMTEETGKEMTAEEVGMMWSDPETRYEALNQVSSKERWSKVVDAVYELNSAFESGPLQAFYQKVAHAVREIDTQKILFFNHSYFCNSGVYTALEPFKLADGTTDPLVAYAAHGYDLLVDTDKLSNSSDDRLELIFERIYQSGKRMNVPVLVGEWGALGGETPGRTELAHKNLKLFEKFLFNNTYWAYGRGTENYSYFKNGVIRPFPELIAGELSSYDYDPVSGEFTCKWNEKADINAPTKIYIPNLSEVSQEAIKLIPDAEGIIIEPIEGSDAGYITILSQGKQQQRNISFTIEKGNVISLSTDK
ncbi:MAG: cellulase family glycosylhydrolase [Marinilabiliaceae bacterium]|nr:cellulase family glycosylhydrolase [Marinilabiliaceae bacterium]